MMPAITVRQPFALALGLGAKPVENRVWAPPERLVGEPWALHAAAWFSRAQVTRTVEEWFRSGMWTGAAAERLATVDDVVRVAFRTTSAVLAVGVLDSVASIGDASPRVPEDSPCPGGCGRKLRECRGEAPQLVCSNGVWVCAGCYDSGFEASEIARVGDGSELFERWRVPGTYGWRFRDVVPFGDPVPAKGRERLWYLPPALEARTRAAWRDAEIGSFSRSIS